MPKITSVNWQTLVKVFEADGFVRARQSGSHIAMTKAGIIRPLVIPAHRKVSVGIICSCLKTAGMSRERYFELLGKW